jgi:transcriptional regulator with XRE-family HTH domain
MARNARTQATGTALSVYFMSRGMTQAQVAAEYSISQSWVGRIYRGEFSARASTVRKMCESAGISFLDDAEGSLDDRSTQHRLLRLLDSVWEGTEEDADHLTAALLALKKMRKNPRKYSKND